MITAGGEWRGDIGRDDEYHGDVRADRGVKFPSKTIVGRGKRLGDGITRWKEDDTQTRLTAECPKVSLQAQELGVWLKQMLYEIMWATTQSDVLRSRLGRRMRNVGGCGRAVGLCGGRRIGWGGRCE